MEFIFFQFYLWFFFSLLQLKAIQVLCFTEVQFKESFGSFGIKKKKIIFASLSKIPS